MDIPPRWQKNSIIATNIIKACPFCESLDNNGNRRSGNIEHLHLYCPSPILKNTRTHCYQKLEEALYNLYNYASIREYNISVKHAPRKSTLQERMEQAAVSAEFSPRTIVSGVKLTTEARNNNIAILSETSVDREIFLGNLPQDKIQEYRLYPLVHRLGILHSIPEQRFKCEHATIIDVGFLGLFPKAVLLVMHQYAKDIEKTSHEGDNTELLSLMHQLITAFVYRPIIIQRVIQLMITRKKQQIEQAWKEAHDAGANRGEGNTGNNDNSIERPTHPPDPNNPGLRQDDQYTNQATSHSLIVCHAIKCRLLNAVGVIRRPMYCMSGKNTCSGCSNELL